MIMISAVIMIAITVLVILNFFGVQSRADELLGELNAITGADDLEGVYAFTDSWEEHRMYFAAGAPMHMIECVDNAVLILNASVLSSSEAEYTKGRLMAERAISELVLYSSFDMQNIL